MAVPAVVRLAERFIPGMDRYSRKAYETYVVLSPVPTVLMFRGESAIPFVRDRVEKAVKLLGEVLG